VRDLFLPFTIGAIAVIAEATSWVWLFLRARNGEYPVTFIGWATLIGDPIVFVLLLLFLCMSLFTKWKYRSKDL
jgi:hypothetical protein